MSKYVGKFRKDPDTLEDYNRYQKKDKKFKKNKNFKRFDDMPEETYSRQPKYRKPLF